jgi:uncharacterized HAD superfamily protein
MNIGIDFDGVIADTPKLKVQYVTEKFNIKINIKNSSKENLSKIIGKDEYTKMIKQAYPSAAMNLVPAVKGCFSALKQLSQENKIIIITSRTDKEVIAAKEWLKIHKVKYNLIINTSNKSKSTVCKKHYIDVLIEDEPENLAEIKYTKTRKILLERPYNVNPKISKEIIRCRNWSEILKVLT